MSEELNVQDLIDETQGRGHHRYAGVMVAGAILHFVKVYKETNQQSDRITALEAEIESAREDNMDLRDAISRSSDSNEHSCKIARDTRLELTALRADNERLRGALAEIRAYVPLRCQSWAIDYSAVVTKAINALAETEAIGDSVRNSSSFADKA